MKAIRLIREPKTQLQGQGNLLKGIDNKSMDLEGCTLFSVTHLMKQNSSNCRFYFIYSFLQNLFSELKPERNNSLLSD